MGRPKLMTWADSQVNATQALDKLIKECKNNMGYFGEYTDEDLVVKPLPVTVDEGAPPRNIYLVSMKAQYKISKAGNDMVNYTATVLEPEEFEGRKVFGRFMFDPTPFKNGAGSQAAMTASHLRHIGGEEWANTLEGDLVDDIIPAIITFMDELEVGIQVRQKENEFEGKKTVNTEVKAFFPASSYGQEED